ncbi:low-affinity inorganic phosphate transporter Pit [Arthrobacter crystallopoietes BAB-32]|uniref:Low-affinity inorganic phosphate transporter Pit n=1 Tax=Arthrobacter crystallopoietes BAB-32 TaxID=1246476 RepID=N1UZN5_9MICC|nr:inorganic phosphate transporter [Arthrobacter crystallopoietes]EMY33239.1 low-affinity inorganic phosphate transporter Pit [Arthrobacter crystallopoietes BAB-32]
MELLLFGAVIAFSACFAFINGFHDVSNSVATAVRTRALLPRVAVVLAALFNFIGVLVAGALALVLSVQGFNVPDGANGLGILLSGLLAACGWGIFTWWRRMPSSSTHALLGGLLGADLAAAFLGRPNVTAAEGYLWGQLALPLLFSPVIAFVIAFVVVYPATWISRYTTPREANRTNRTVQAVLTGAFSLGHGLQDGQRTVAVLLLALGAVGLAGSGTEIPLWVQLFVAVFLSVGTLFGGWRIAHTLGYRLVRMDPLRGAIAQGVSSAMLYLGALALHMPLSSTHTMASAILGAGANQRFGTVRWRVAQRVLLTWVVTALASALMGATLYLALDPLL